MNRRVLHLAVVLLSLVIIIGSPVSQTIAAAPAAQEKIMKNTTPRRALILIDVQNEYDGGGLPIEYPPVGQSLANIGRAMGAAKAVGIPVVVVQNVAPSTSPIFAEGTHGAELHQVVRSRGWDHLVQKKLPGSFSGTDLEAWLRKNRVDTLVVAGYMTHNCDASTVIQAVHAGYAVEFLSDASGSLPYRNRAGQATAEEMHRVFMVVMQSRFAAVMNTEEWIGIVNGNGVPVRDNILESNRQARLTGK